MKFLIDAVVYLAVAIVLLCFPAAWGQSAISSGDAEDISTASLASSHLRPASPELEEKTEEPDYISEWITVGWRPDDPIYLYVIRPVHVSKPPAVIYMYDYLSDTDIFRDDDWCKRTTGGGYAAIGFVPALTGHRFHNRPMKEWFVSEMQEALAKSAHDVQMVLNYLDQRGDIDMNRIGIFGVGAGGTISAMAASADSRIKAVDLVDPWGDWPEWLAKSAVVPNPERPNYLKPEFLKKIAAFDPVALLPQLKTPHIRLDQLDSNSGEVPKDAQSKIETALPASAEKHRLHGDIEAYAGAVSDGRAFDWMKQQLKPASGHAVNAQSKPAVPSTVKN